MTIEEQLNVLSKARRTYGYKHQITVCMEELNELSCVLAKFPRYESTVEARSMLHDAVLDEVADVMVILDHVQNIFGLSDDEIADRIDKKIERLNRWLHKNESPQTTLEDRRCE